MVQINVLSRLSLFEKTYACILDWKDDQTALESILLKNAEDAEKKVYQNIKDIECDVLINFANSAIEKLDSDDWKI